jgi:hypothetical protein
MTKKMTKKNPRPGERGQDPADSDSTDSSSPERREEIGRAAAGNGLRWAILLFLAGGLLLLIFGGPSPPI